MFLILQKDLDGNAIKRKLFFIEFFLQSGGELISGKQIVTVISLNVPFNNNLKFYKKLTTLTFIVLIRLKKCNIKDKRQKAYTHSEMDLHDNPIPQYEMLATMYQGSMTELIMKLEKKDKEIQMYKRELESKNEFHKRELESLDAVIESLDAVIESKDAVIESKDAVIELLKENYELLKENLERRTDEDK